MRRIIGGDWRTPCSVEARSDQQIGDEGQRRHEDGVGQLGDHVIHVVAACAHRREHRRVGHG